MYLGPVPTHAWSLGSGFPVPEADSSVLADVAAILSALLCLPSRRSQPLLPGIGFTNPLYYPVPKANPFQWWRDSQHAACPHPTLTHRRPV